MGVESSPDDDPTVSDIEHASELLDTDSVAFVDDVNNDIAELIEESEHLRYDYIIGDISDADVSSNGHLHFDLVHDDSLLHCVVFKYRRESLDIEIVDGIQVAIKGEVSYYADGAQISILVEEAVEIGEGLYEQTYRQNKGQLREEGLLDDAAKQSLPELPTCVGIATSRESDACTDVITSIHDRHPDVDIVIQDTGVQGDDAMASMMGAISQLDDDPAVDVIILTRGGGAEKHLRVFNETPLCRVVHNADTPVVAGIGHENDRTLVGETADRRVMTPTHAGEIVPEKTTLIDQQQRLADRLDTVYTRVVTTRLTTLDEQLDTAYRQRIRAELAARQTALDHAFETTVTERLTSLDRRLDHSLTQLQQQKTHEAEKESAIAQYRRSTKRQRVLIIVLIVLLLLLIAYILV